MAGPAKTELVADTVRAFIEALAEAAAGLSDGLDTEIELAICDGESLQFIDDTEVQAMLTVYSGTVEPDGGGFVIIRGHWHPGESPGRVQRSTVLRTDDDYQEVFEDEE